MPGCTKDEGGWQRCVAIRGAIIMGAVIHAFILVAIGMDINHRFCDSSSSTTSFSARH